MADTENIYRRLPGTGYRRIVPGWVLIPLFFVIGIFVLLLRGNRVQLWQGNEHLILVEWSGYKEKYKRFNYRDIQAVIVQRTNESRIVNIIMTALFVLFAAPALVVQDTGGKIGFLVIAGFCGFILLINLIAGPSCKCYLRTAVQLEELPSLTRVRNVKKVLERIRPLISNAQGGEVSPDLVSTWMRDMVASSTRPASSKIIADELNVPPRLTP